MGLISFLKSIFNKNIECEENLDNHIVFLLEKKKYLYINKNIIVRDGSVCVVCYKNRVADVILPGKYKLNEQTIPETIHRAKLNHIDNRKNKLKKIKVEIFFVNTNNYSQFDFVSNEPFIIKSKQFGRIKGCLKGICNVRVIDSASLVKALFSSKHKVKNKNINKIISLKIGNKINKRIQKNKVPIETILNNNSSINSILNSELEDAFDNIGIYVTNIKLKAVDFSKKYQKKINNNFERIKNFSIPQISNKQIQDNVDCDKVSIANQSLNSTMRNNKIFLNNSNFKVCKYCGCRNNIQQNCCNNCGHKL